MVDRKEGYYWVRLKKEDDYSIAEWYGSYWTILRSDECIFWKPFEIDEVQIIRNCSCGRELSVQYYCNICDNDE